MGKLKALIDKLIYSHATPEEVAQGFAWGIFVALTPTMGFQMILALALTALIRKNEIAAMIACWITNPITAAPIYYFNFQVGQIITGNENVSFKIENLSDIASLGWDFFYLLTVGGFAVSLVVCPLSYFIVKKVYPILRNKKKSLKTKLIKKES